MSLSLKKKQMQQAQTQENGAQISLSPSKNQGKSTGKNSDDKQNTAFDQTHPQVNERDGQGKTKRKGQRNKNGDSKRKRINDSNKNQSSKGQQDLYKFLKNNAQRSNSKGRTPPTPTDRGGSKMSKVKYKCFIKGNDCLYASKLNV